MAKAMGGDLVLQLLHEFREMQEEARVQYEKTDVALLAVNQKAQVLFGHTEVLYERTRVLSEQTRVLSEQTRVLSEQTRVLSEHAQSLFEATGAFKEKAEDFTTELLGLTKELSGLKRVQSRTGVLMNQILDIQLSDRQRIDALEHQVNGAGER